MAQLDETLLPLPDGGPAAATTKFAGLDEQLTFLEAMFSLVLSMLGAGVVAFPYCYNLCGYVLGSLLLIFFGCVAWLSYSLLVQSSKATTSASYGDLVEGVPQPWGHFTKLSLWLLLVLVNASYTIIVADIVRSVALTKTAAPSWWLANSYLFAGILLIPFPLCLLKSFHALAGVSSFCSVAIVAAIALMVWELELVREETALIVPTAASRTPIQQESDVAPFVLAIPIVAVSMFGHMNMSQIYAELKPQLKPRANAVAGSACMIVTCVYMAIGVLGYTAFGANAGPDILVSVADWTGGSTGVAIIQMLLAAFLLFKMPLIVLPLRAVTHSIVSPDGNRDLSTGSHALLTFALMFASYLATIALPNLDTLLEVMGALCVIPISFIVPARIAWSHITPRPMWQCIALGAVGVSSSVLSIVQLVSKHAHS
eukprot:TRINITY_DN41746_c0_g1_i1.p1 TRINITY_DN41746_c0_g1~~TRINITY_DN41746_c0_g1_i1.p1  ORF type:complete len:450 (-),score=47.46 TRINITY_DN41746_c0_g1_i1:106-1389(-)